MLRRCGEGAPACPSCRSAGALQCMGDRQRCHKFMAGKSALLSLAVGSTGAEMPTGPKGKCARSSLSQYSTNFSPPGRRTAADQIKEVRGGAARSVMMICAEDMPISAGSWQRPPENLCRQAGLACLSPFPSTAGVRRCGARRVGGFHSNSLPPPPCRRRTGTAPCRHFRPWREPSRREEVHLASCDRFSSAFRRATSARIGANGPYLYRTSGNLSA